MFFCGNAATGFVFLVALFVGGLTAGLAACVGVVSSTATASLLGLPERELDEGLFGFNGTLVGPCLFALLEGSPQLWLYVILASALSTIVMAAMTRLLAPCKVPAATAPFVLTSWMFLAAAHSFEAFSRGAMLPRADLATEMTDAAAIAPQAWFTALAKGVSEVMLADSVLVGALFLAGIAITSPRGALMAAVGASIGVAFPIALGADEHMIELGLYAFNPVLTTMALGWVFLKPGIASTLVTVFAGLMTVVCQAALAGFLAPVGLPTLTFPFVLTTWIFLLAAERSRVGSTGLLRESAAP